VARYLGILRRREALLPFLAAVVARLPFAMCPLGIVLLVQQVRGAYAIAGLVTAAFAVSMAVATPVWGRLIDRFGQPRILASTAVVSASCLALLAVSAVTGAPDAVLLVSAAGVGLTFPLISPSMRGAWRVVLTDDADRQAAYALDAVAVETIFVGGPLLLSLLLVVATPVVPLLVTAGLLAGGSLAYSATGAARAWRPEPHHQGAGYRSASPVRSVGVLGVMLVCAGLAIGFGQCDVSIAATARETFGSQAQIGALFAAIAGGSVTGGLWYGARAWRRPEQVLLPVALTGFALGLGALAGLLVSGHAPMVAMLAVLYLTGLSIAPALIMLANLMDRLAPRDRLSEAQSWLNTAFTAGGAAGTAVAGAIIDIAGPAGSFAGACAAVALTALGAVLVQPRWRTALRPVGQVGVTD
jgi:MFS family permease